MMACPPPVRGCKYDRPFISRHHKYWPRSWYKTPLEKAFRSDPRNIVRMCDCEHRLEHLKKPPKKPSKQEMRRFLGGKWMKR
jgi:hypothetical protein